MQLARINWLPSENLTEDTKKIECFYFSEVSHFLQLNFLSFTWHLWKQFPENITFLLLTSEIFLSEKKAAINQNFNYSHLHFILFLNWNILTSEVDILFYSNLFYFILPSEAKLLFNLNAYSRDLCQDIKYKLIHKCSIEVN